MRVIDETPGRKKARRKRTREEAWKKLRKDLASFFGAARRVIESSLLAVRSAAHYVGTTIL